MTPTSPADDAVDRFAEAWRLALKHHSYYIPISRRSLRTALREMTLRLVDALQQTPVDIEAASSVGARLFATNAATPDALEATLHLLGGQLLTDLDLDPPDAPQRLAAALASLARGFTEALRRQVLEAAEELGRAERLVWRQQRQSHYDQLQHTLLHDQLTGLPNRAGLTHYLDHLLTDPTGTQQLGLCILDLDRFNDLSNALGPDTADHLLLAVASRLYALIAGTTCLAYLGADRFAFVVHPTTVDDVIKLTEHALAVISEPFTVAGNDILVTATAGVVEGDRIGATADELLRTAGQALGWARDEGRPVVAYDPDRGAKDIVRYQIATDMNAALRNEQFTLAYQPLIDLSTRTMVGVEGLARWHHPTHGEIPPHQFIADANRTGLIVELGAYLLHRACTQAAIWQRTTSAPFVVSVNVSTVQLRQPAFAHTVAAILNRTGLTPQGLMLEVTEEGLFDPDGTALTTVDALRHMGIRIAIDDFGAGYSSLSRMDEIRVHVLKLDGRFLKNLHPERDKRRAKFLSAVVRLCVEQGLTVIAEGIENPALTAYLAAIGCHIGQGYALGRPSPKGAITERLTG